jgi:hypothetical protein
MLKQIDAAMVEANIVFQNSRVNARVHLARATEINYMESGSVSNDLAQLTNPGNGILAQVHRLRDQVSADLVCMITETGSDWWFYGLQGPSAENAFSIIRRPYLTGGYYFPVALSFNFGCQLERSSADSVGAFPYAYGYSFWGNGTFYSTVEAFSGQRIPYFSNPDILFQGVPIGVPAGLVNAANNALVINQTAPIVAAFRGSASVTQPPSVSIIAPSTAEKFRAGTNVNLHALATDPDGMVVRVDYYAGTNWLASSTTSPFNAIWHHVSIGEYSLFAVAADNAGATTISDPVQITVVPINDDFVARSRILGTTSVVNTDNTLASAELGEPDHAGIPASHSLWWTYTAPANGVVVVDASASSFRASLDVYTGNVLNALTEVTSTAGTGESAVRFQVTAGQAYQIAVDSPNGDPGAVQLNLHFAPLPANDNFSRRQQLNGSSINLNADNRGATLEPGEPAISGTHGIASLWWSWTAPANGQASFTASSSNSVTFMVGVYTGTVLTNLTPVPDQWVQAGVTYQIAVESPADPLATGPFVLGLNFSPEPVNDSFAGRTTISGTDISLINSSVLAVADPGTPYPYFPTLWWSWMAPVTGYVTVGGPSSQFMYVYTGTTATNLTLVASQWPEVSFEAIAGTTYTIAGNGPPGEVVLNLMLSTVRIIAPQDGAVFFNGNNIVLNASATEIDGTLSQIQFFNNGNPIGTAQGAPYSIVWTNVPAGDYALTAVGTDVFGQNRSSPPVNITVQYAPPSNDNFSNRTVIPGTWVMLTNSDYAATPEPGEPSIAGTGWLNSIWWAWTAPASGNVTIYTPTFATALAVYTGNSVSNLAVVTGGWPAINFEASAGTTYDIAAAGWPGNVVLQLTLSNLRIASPANEAVFVSGTNISIVADVTATEQPVSRVEFFHDGISLGAVSSSPYGIVWTNVPAGNYSLVAVATDTLGHARTSPAIAISVRPANDDFRHAIVLSGEIIHTNGSTVGATMEPGEPYHDGPYGGNSVWYSWTAPDSDRYSVVADSFGQFAALLAVYTGSNVTNLSLVCSNGNWQSATFSARAGTNYFIAVDSTAGWVQGNFALDILKPPANDNFSNRISITNLSLPILGNNLAATAEPAELAGIVIIPWDGFHSVWWTWTATYSGWLTMSGLPAGYSADLSLSTGTSISNLTPVQISTIGSSGLSQTYQVTGGTTYQIKADGHWNPDWSISFNLAFAPSPANDDFANAFVLSGTNVTTIADNTEATSEPGEHNHAGSSAEHSVWYSWTAPVPGLVTVAVSGTNFTPAMAAYTGTDLANLTEVGNRVGGSVSFNATAGTNYKIAVDGSGGFFVLSLSIIPPPENDDFESRFLLSGMNPAVQGTTYLATGEPGEPSFYPWVVDRSVWYSWIAPTNGTVRVHCPSRPIAIYSGSSITNLTSVAPVNPGSFDDLVFSATAGTEYEIAVAGAWWLPDNFTLSLVMPKAQIVSPTNGDAFPLPANFEIIARTIDVDGNVVSVSFFDGTNLLATATSAPFQTDYLNVPAGMHQLSLQSTDVNGLITVSEPVEVRVEPTNDDFAQSITITNMTATLVADNSGATSEPGEYLPGGASGQTLWWTWTAPATGVVTVATSAFSATPALVTSTPNIKPLPPGARVDNSAVKSSSVIIIGPGNGNPPGPTAGPLIDIYTGSSVTNLSLYASNSVWFSTWFNSGEWCVLPSVSFPVVVGQTYQLSLDGVNGSYGAATLSFSFSPPPIPPSPPANDNFAQAAILSGSSLTITGTTVGATNEPGEPSSGSDPAARTVWYSWTAAASGNAEVTALANDYSDLNVGVYAGSSLWTLIPVMTGSGQVSFYALAGITYKIVVAGPNGSAMDFSLELDGSPPPPTLIATRQSNGSYQIQVTGVVGQSFIVQASTNSVNWVTVRTDTLIGTSLNFTDTTAAGSLPRYYRILPLDTQLNDEPFVVLPPSIEPNAGFTLHLAGVSGQPFRVQVTTNFMDWSDLTNGILVNEVFDFTDPNAPQFSSRFYRAIKQ